MTMHRHAQAHFSKLGVTVEQYVVLSFLAEDEGVTQRELSDGICSDVNTIAAMVRLMEERSLLSRRRHENDGRAFRLHLTAKGRRLQKTLVASAESMHKALDQAVGLTRRPALLDGLARIEATFQAESNEDDNGL